MQSNIELPKNNTHSKRDVAKNNAWVEDGYDFFLDLGSMKRAVVVALYKTVGESYYSVSPRSYFPFTEKQLSLRFENAEDCMIFSIEIIKNWIKSILC